MTMHRIMLMAWAMAGLGALPAVPVHAQQDMSPAVRAWLESVGDGRSAAEVDFGRAIDGWSLSDRDGTCRASSSNSRLSIRIDTVRPEASHLHFSMVDADFDAVDGAVHDVHIAMRGTREGPFALYPVQAYTSQKLPLYGYTVPVKVRELVALYPDGFQIVLLDAAKTPIAQADLLGRPQLIAALGACGR